MIPDEPEPILSPHQPGDGGILTMPLRDNVPEPDGRLAAHHLPCLWR